MSISFRNNGSRNRPYDLTLLNDLHEILPEMLYDSEMFPSGTFMFFQNRIGNMFASVYHRERTTYLREQADSRRRVHIRPSRIPNPIIRPRETHMTGPQPPATPLSNPTLDALFRNILVAIATDMNSGGADETDDAPSTTPLTAVAPTNQSNITVPIRVQQRELSRNGIGGIQVTIPGNTNPWWDPVSVHPTPTVYAGATEILDSSGVSLDVNCAICQSHTYETSSTAPNTSWRKIRRCGHLFHTPCADEWFGNHINCPICRRDIRPPASSTTE